MLSIFLGYFWTTAAQAFAAEIDAMAIVYETVEDGVRPVIYLGCEPLRSFRYDGCMKIAENAGGGDGMDGDDRRVR